MLTRPALYLAQLHPNPNLKNPDPAVDLKIVVGASAQKHAVRCAAARCVRLRCSCPRDNTAGSTLLIHTSTDAAPRALAQVDVALSNSFGFGGHNSCILFSAFKP